MQKVSLDCIPNSNIVEKNTTGHNSSEYNNLGIPEKIHIKKEMNDKEQESLGLPEKTRDLADSAADESSLEDNEDSSCLLDQTSNSDVLRKSETNKRKVTRDAISLNLQPQKCSTITQPDDISSDESPMNEYNKPRSRKQYLKSCGKSNEKVVVYSSVLFKTASNVIKCFECDFGHENKLMVQKHLLTEHTKESYKCYICSVEYHRLHILNHFFREHKCSECGVLCKDRQSLINHYKEHSCLPNDSYVPTYAEINKYDNTVSCYADCGEKFSSQSLAVQHSLYDCDLWQNQHSPLLKCKTCKFECNEQSCFINHQIEQHGFGNRKSSEDEKSNLTPDYKMTGKAKAEIYNHEAHDKALGSPLKAEEKIPMKAKKDNPRIQKFKCSLCSKTYLKKSNLKIHIFYMHSKFE